jgi:hypothetical protein
LSSSIVNSIKTISLNIMLFLNGIFVFGQNKNTILYEVEKSKNQKIDSLIGFNTDKNKLEYLAVLPTVNYNFLDNTFNVGVSLSNLANFYQNKQRNKIELERLKFQLTEKKENDLFELEKEYELIRDTYEVLKLELDNTTLTIEIFNLKKAQYENNKITLEEWLNVQKNNQDRNLVLFAKRKNLVSKMKQFEVKVKSSCFLQELKYLSTTLTNQ